MAIAYSNIGKNSNFMCSHTDSFIGVKRPTIAFLPDHWYKKWASVPVHRTKRIPIIVMRFRKFISYTSELVYAFEVVLCGNMGELLFMQHY